MKYLYLLGVFLSLTIASCTTSDKPAETDSKMEIDSTASMQSSELYRCPMHPDIESDQPGDCSECGMALEKVVEE